MDVAQSPFQAPIPTAPPPPNYPSPQPDNQQMSPYGQPQQSSSYTQAQSLQNNVGGALVGLAALSTLKRGGRRSRGGLCGVLAGVLVLVILAGVSFAIFKPIGTSIGKTNSLGSSSTNNGVLTTQPPITTTQINAKVPYAGVDITIVNAQQSLAFLDDTSSRQDGMLRVNLQENSSPTIGSFFYGEIAILILPDKTNVTPLNELHSLAPDSGTTRMNWLDYPLSKTINPIQLTLQIGHANEAQIVVPLTGKADLTMYKSKTVNPNVTTQYAGLSWTVMSASIALNAAGQQAPKEMRFVTLILTVNNPSANDFTGYDGDYIRLTSDGITSPPTSNSNFPTGFNANSTGTTGTLIFVMPEASTSYTLTLLNNSSSSFTQATAVFQIA